MSPRLRHLLTTTALIGAAFAAAPAAGQPTGGNVVGGSATITGAGTNSVIVNQTTDRAIINWNTFNISTGGSATFNQPGTSSITLNRVTGGLGPSVIDGTITANGRVFIINRDGMLFGRNAVINTAGFLATTNDIRNADFMAGRMQFNIPGRPDASIVNFGTITASSGGFAALVAPGVRNTGTISARLGTVALAAGNNFTLDMYGDKLIQLAVGDEIAGKVIDVATGKPLSALVSNDGRLSASGGRVEITAAAARHIVDSVINNRGVIEANSVGTRNGMIVLGGATASSKTAGLPKQTVKVSGKLTATGSSKGAKGGTIQITGEDIQFAAAMLDVSGDSGGGKILIGGDYGGGRPIPGTVTNQSAVLESYAIPTATTVTVDAATTFNASATANGNGGKVILWSDMLTTYAGTIFARGGEFGGNGGFVEVSGKQQLAFTGLVDTRAPRGQAGTLLLDPDDFPIGSAEAATIVANLGMGNVIILTSAAGSGGVGDITVNSPIVWSGYNSLTLSAYRNVVVNAAIDNSGGGANITLRADNAGTGTGTVSFGGSGAVATDFGSVAIIYNPASYTDLATKSDTSGNPYSSFVTVGMYGTFTASMLVNSAANLQAIGDNLSGYYALGRDIDATAFSFTPLATFDGKLDGLNRTITGLATTGASPFPAVDGEIRNLNLVNVNVTATGDGQIIGGLVGTLAGGTIDNVSIAGTVSGSGGHFDLTAGGLVGLAQSGSTISNSRAAVTVTIATSSDTCCAGFARSAFAGGLAGVNMGSIINSSASGDVTGGGGSIIGGLVGSNGLAIGDTAVSIANSYATGAVNSIVTSPLFAAHAGGLAGANWGTISNSYATGNVLSSGPVMVANIGGLVGQLMGEGTIETSYASGNVTLSNTYSGTEASSAGGLVGAVQADAAIYDSYALGNVTVSGVTSSYSIWAGGFVGSLEGYINRAYSTGKVETGLGNAATTYLGGFVGRTVLGSDISAAFWDTESSERSNATGDGSVMSGIVGLTSAQARTQSCYETAACGSSGDFAFDVEGAWFMVDGQTRPFLRMEHSTEIRNAHQLQLMAAFPSLDYKLVNSIDFTGQFGASGMWGATGFAPIGSSGNPFTGSLNGNGFTINALTIAPNNATLQSVGLFGTIGETGSVSNLNLTNADVKANPGYTGMFHQWVGVLAGQSGGTISNVSATGTVDGLSVVGVIAGGLVGQHGLIGMYGFTPGTISGSQATVNVTVADGTCPEGCTFNAAGGLVGANIGGSSIASSHAGGTIQGGALTFAGGLVGQNGFYVPEGAIGTIANSYATGNVTVTGNGSAAGGLVGNNAPGSTITDSQAFGTVASTFNAPVPDQFTSAGGLVGQNAGTVTSTTTPLAASSTCAAGAAFSCATGNVSVGASGDGGGLVGFNSGTIEKSFAIGSITGASGIDNDAATHLGGLAGSNHGTITQSFAHTGTIGSTGNNFTLAGGLVADNSGTISGSTAGGNVTVGDTSMAGGLAANNSSSDEPALFGTGASNAASISNSSATGAVSVGSQSFGGGLVGGGLGSIDSSFATGNVTGRALSMVGGLVGANIGDITTSHATGNVTTDQGFAGGLVGFNVGSITLSYATGSVSSTALAFVGGFVGVNAGEINQAYANGAVSGGPGSFVGGFVGLNLNADVGFPEAPESSTSGLISQAYGFGPVTGNNAVVAGGFAALNLGSLVQTYAVGHVQGAGAILGGLVGANNLSTVLPDFGQTTTFSVPNGTATNSYWDYQTTAMLTSAGGTGMNTAVLAGGLPPGFDPAIWSHGSYPYLLNLGPQNTNPGPPVIGPVGGDQSLPPPIFQINSPPPGGPSSNDPIPNSQQFLAQQQGGPAGPGGPGGAGGAGGGGAQGGVPGGLGPQPIRLDVGENRFFYLPPPEETRLVSNEVVLQLPCDTPASEVAAIVKQHNMTIVASQCLQEGGNAAYRMRYASRQTVAAVIRALAAHRIIAAAQANYTYALAETKVQSATSQQGDPGQYVPEKLRLLDAHRLVTGTGVRIGVIDSEVDAAHPDYSAAIDSRYDATGVDDSPHPHGTGMTGAIASRQKLLGVAPGARILAIRAFSSRTANAESTTYHILRGIDWAINNKVRIINMSFAGPRDPSIERALKMAYDRDIVLIAAAGNAGPRAPAMFPAADPNVIAVTATDLDDRLFSGANRGNHVAIAAPGVDILVPAPSGEYQVTTGTSVATAHISGVVALMLERNPKLRPADVRKILAASARRLGPSNQFGAGLVDPMRAIEMATPRSAAARP